MMRILKQRVKVSVLFEKVYVNGWINTFSAHCDKGV